MNEFALIFGMMLVTFGVRYPVLALVGRIRLPEIIIRTLRYVPAAVLTAIITPATLMPDGSSLALNLSNPRLIGALVSILVAYRTSNLLLTILIGMATFWGWRALIF